MKKIALIFGLIPFAAMAETDAEIALNGVIDNVRNQCGGISAELESLKKMAGIGTVVNAVGTVAGAGGVVSGVLKAKQDAQVLGGELNLLTLEAVKEKLSGQEKSTANMDALKRFYDKIPNANFEQLKKSIESLATSTNVQNIDREEAGVKQKITTAQSKSDTFGNVRTGLFAANTATSAAGAVLSSKTGVDETLDVKIKGCAESMVALQNASTRVRLEDGENANTALLDKSQNILDKCSEYKNVDTESLNKLSKGGIITGSVGAATGLAATVTSIIGTKNKVSDIDLKSENSMDEVNKFATINTASNVLGGVNAATSLTGAVLNATQIKKIKEVVTISENCEEALQ